MFSATKMTYSSEKLRFLACEQVESTLKGLFPFSQVLPFGSSVNSFGKLNSDLDMVITLKNLNQSQKSKSRLVFHTRGKNELQSKQLMSFVSYSLQVCVFHICASTHLKPHLYFHRILFLAVKMSTMYSMLKSP